MSEVKMIAGGLVAHGLFFSSFPPPSFLLFVSFSFDLISLNRVESKEG